MTRHEAARLFRGPLALKPSSKRRPYVRIIELAWHTEYSAVVPSTPRTSTKESRRSKHFSFPGADVPRELEFQLRALPPISASRKNVICPIAHRVARTSGISAAANSSPKVQTSVVSECKIDPQRSSP